MKQFDRGKKVSNELGDFTTTPRLRFHLSREYAMDPLEVLFVRQVMRRSVLTLQQAQTFRVFSKQWIKQAPRNVCFPLLTQEGAL